MIRICIRTGGCLRIAERQGCEGPFHTPIICCAEAFGSHPVLVLEMHGSSGIEGYWFAAPIVLSLDLGVAVAVPNRDALTVQVEDELLGRATLIDSHPPIERIVV